jgi:uncharacterized LabA/DUF88 family protein
VATERTHRRHTPNSGPVALFVDWDNFAIGLRQEMPERPPDLGPILRWARRTGTLIVSRAYGEWRDATERLAIYNAGVDAVYAPVLPLGGSLAARSGAGGAKSLADTAMAVDVAEFLTLVPSVQTLILATSDKDLIPVIRFAQKRGVYSGVVGSDRTAAALRELADEFVTYRQLLEDEAPQPIAVSRPVTVPPLRIARPLRRFGDPIAEPLAPILREPRSLIATPSIARREPIIAQPVEPELGTLTSDPDSDSARRRRRGGRRRRGAETLALGDTTTQVDDDVAAEVPGSVERPVSAPQSAVAAPPVTTPRPAIVPPLISPRPPRPIAERFASPVIPTPETAVSRPVPPNESAPDASAKSGPLTISNADPTETSTSASAPITRITAEMPAAELGEASPARRPRVQLPGERLRRLVPVGDAPPAIVPAEVVAVAPAPVDDRSSTRSGDEVAAVPNDTHGDEPATDATPKPQASPHAEVHVAEGHPDSAPVAVPVEADTDSSDHQSTGVPPEETAPRARRRRGGRNSRAVADGSSAPEPPLPIIDGPIASPNDPDAASAPDPGTDGPVRGRRRGGRARASA